MGKDMSFRESPATAEEDSFDYRVTWDDHIRMPDDLNGEIIHDGSGSNFFSHNFDNAWENYCSLLKSPYYVNVHLIQIYPDGREILHS